MLLSSTWLLQQLIILYFKWYIITNDMSMTEELMRFSTGASYPPALLGGMFIAAIPPAIISLMRSRHFCWNLKSPTDSISSTMRISGDTIVATEKPSRAFIPDEKFFIGESRKSCSSAKSRSGMTRS